jgi:acetyl esterase
MTFDQDVLALFAAMRAANAPTIDTMPVREGRLMFAMQAGRLAGPVAEMADVRDLAAEGPAGAIPLRLYRPHGAPAEGAPLLLYFHGGGWVIGDLDTHDGLCRDIAARAACLVLAVDYRLAPEHPAPAAAEDAIAALRWTLAHATTLGADPARLAVGGDSAGGNLAAVAALTARDEGVKLRAQILIYPAVDLRAGMSLYPSQTTNAGVPPLTRPVMDWFMDKYLPAGAGETLAADWRLSPILAPDKAGLAPALIIVAENDALHDEGLAYADALEAAGVPVERLDVPGMIHGFIGMTGEIGAAGAAIDWIAEKLEVLLTK